MKRPQMLISKISINLALGYLRSFVILLVLVHHFARLSSLRARPAGFFSGTSMQWAGLDRG